jgi:hypothetical protein
MLVAAFIKPGDGIQAAFLDSDHMHAGMTMGHPRRLSLVVVTLGHGGSQE